MTLVGIALVGIGTTLAGTTLTSNEGPGACALVVVVLRAIASALRALLARSPRDFLGRSLRLPRAPRHSDASHAAVLRYRQHTLASTRPRPSTRRLESAWQKPHTSEHVLREWRVLGFGKCGVTTSVRVQIEALSLLLRNGA
jgi:hypothetical protein